LKIHAYDQISVSKNDRWGPEFFSEEEGAEIFAGKRDVDLISMSERHIKLQTHNLIDKVLCRYQSSLVIFFGITNQWFCMGMKLGL
jgi:hypothetical protein